MNLATESQISFLERRLSCLQLLVRELTDCRAAYVALDLERIHKHIFLQAALSERLRELERECCEAIPLLVAGLRAADQAQDSHPAAAETPNEVEARVLRLVEENDSAASELRRLNAIQRRFVDGTRATFDALARAFLASGPTYSHPALPPRIERADPTGS